MRARECRLPVRVEGGPSAPAAILGTREPPPPQPRLARRPTVRLLHSSLRHFVASTRLHIFASSHAPPPPPPRPRPLGSRASTSSVDHQVSRRPRHLPPAICHLPSATRIHLPTHTSTHPFIHSSTRPISPGVRFQSASSCCCESTCVFDSSPLSRVTPPPPTAPRHFEAVKKKSRRVLRVPVAPNLKAAACVFTVTCARRPFQLSIHFFASASASSICISVQCCGSGRGLRPSGASTILCLALACGARRRRRIADFAACSVAIS